MSPLQKDVVNAGDVGLDQRQPREQFGLEADLLDAFGQRGGVDVDQQQLLEALCQLAQWNVVQLASADHDGARPCGVLGAPQEQLPVIDPVLSPSSCVLV